MILKGNNSYKESSDNFDLNRQQVDFNILPICPAVIFSLFIPVFIIFDETLPQCSISRHVAHFNRQTGL